MDRKDVRRTGELPHLLDDELGCEVLGGLGQPLHVAGILEQSTKMARRVSSPLATAQISSVL